MSGETPAGSSERQSAPLLDISCRLFGAVLLLPGPRLQAQRRPEAVELFRDLYRNAYVDAGWRGIARTWLSALWGAVRNADKPPPRPDRQPRPRRDGTMQRVFYDFKHAARSLRRHPGFASLTATTLALGIGANVAIFSVVYGVVIQPLPYRQADELVYLAHNAPGAGFTEGELILAPGLYRYYRERSRTLESIGAWRYREATLSSHGDPEIVLAASATSSLFRVLRVPAFMGRTFIEEDDAEGAEEKERLKMDLVSALAHDMKSPLGSIMGYAKIMMDQFTGRSDGKTNLEILERIQHGGQRIVNLVTGFLEAGKAEAGKLEITDRPVSLNSLLKEVAQQQEWDLEKKRLTLELNLDEKLPDIYGDEDQLDRVFWNLIGNAIKFTSTGGKVTVSSRRDDEHVRVAIKDTGIGIPRDELPLLFSQFKRLKGSAKIEGTGLGLFIVKTIIEAHKGTVRAESGNGQGSTFTIRIPIRS